MKNWYEEATKKYQLSGKSEGTVKAYTRAVRLLVDHCGKTPDLISEEELQEFFLHKKEVEKWSKSSHRISICGIRHFYENVLLRKWHILNILSVQKERKLPTILTVTEIRQILNQLRTQRQYTCLSTIYSCGLRISEVVSLKVSDIDSKRMMIHVHAGKGAKDRYVPLPEVTLIILRKFWKTHRNPTLLFPGKDPEKHISTASVQTALKKAIKTAGILKPNISAHCLRHYVEPSIMGRQTA